MPMSEPLISVVLPVYNGLPYLDRALGSILAQDHRNIEVVAIDDGSTDGSGELLRTAQRRDPRIRLIARENRGLIATLNEGLREARGAFVARMDADDIAYPARFRRQVEAFREDPELAMSGTLFDVVFGRDRVAATAEAAPAADDLPILSMFYTVFRHSTVMFNRRVLPEPLLRYDPAYPHAEDMDLFRRIAGAYRTRVLPEVLVGYRVHDESVTTTRAREMRRTHLRILQESLASLGVTIEVSRLMPLGVGGDAQAVADMVAIVAACDRLAAEAPAEQRSAFADGAAKTFFLLLRWCQDEYGLGHGARFLDLTEGWRRMRRREHYLIRGLRRVPVLGQAVWRFSHDLDLLERNLRSAPLERAVPALEPAHG